MQVIPGPVPVTLCSTAFPCPSPQSQGCGYPVHVLLSPLSFQRRCLFLYNPAYGSLSSRHSLLLKCKPLWATLTYLLGKGCFRLLLLQESTWIRAGKGLVGKTGGSSASSPLVNWEKGSSCRLPPYFTWLSAEPNGSTKLGVNPGLM